ncbi:MAG: prolipoprotein diacylglyceryl transferase [Lactovum sp.]
MNANILTLSPIAIKLGPIAIHWYAIIIISGAVIGIWLAMREAGKKGWDTELILDYILVAFPLSLVGARLYYVAFEWSYYSSHLSEVFAIWNGGIAIYGALITAFLYLLFFCHYKKIKILEFLDIVAPAVLIGQSIGRWGNFVNQEAYGKVVENLDYLPEFIQNQMMINDSYRQPTFLFESIGTFLGFLLIILFRHRLKFLKSGDIFAFYLIWYGIIRAVVEGMRTDSLMLYNLRVSQWLSLILVIIGLIFLIINHGKKKTNFSI